MPAKRPRASVEARTALVALGVFVLVFLVALGSSRSLAHIGGPGELSRVRSISGTVIMLLIGIAVVPATAYALWRTIGELREEAPPGQELPPTWKRLAVQLSALAVFALALIIAVQHWHPRSVGPKPQSPKGPSLGVTGAQTASERTAASLALWVIGAAAISFVLLLVTILIVRSRRSLVFAGDLTPGGELERRRRDLSEAVSVSLAEIEAEPDPRRAVIRAYAGLERTLAQHGLGRHESEAPAEFLLRALGAVRISGRACERLTRLFERARFSTHTIEPGMKREAIAALSEVRDELKEDTR